MSSPSWRAVVAAGLAGGAVNWIAGGTLLGIGVFVVGLGVFRLMEVKQ